MKGCIRIAAATPELRLGHPDANAEEHARIAMAAADRKVSVLVFPELSLTGYTCGDLFFRPDLIQAAESALKHYAQATASLPLISIVGCPEQIGDNLYNAAAVVANGAIVGRIHKRTLANFAEYYEKRQFDPAANYEPLTVFEADGVRFGIEICEDLWSPVPPSSRMAGAGLDIVFNLSASTDFLGKAQSRTAMVTQQSQRLGCAYALSAAGVGESTADAVYGGGSLIAVEGRVVDKRELFSEPGLLTSDIDLEVLRYHRRSTSSIRLNQFCEELQIVKVGISPVEVEPTRVDPAPFLSKYAESGWIEKLLTIQAVSLTRRMAAAHASGLAIGISGGADSALALMGAARAVKRADGRLIAVIMPGFASSGATQGRAAELAAQVGSDVHVIDICAACRQHLRDIGHGESVHDIVFENVQARERTQVLMDIANKENALVVGTGDLSEIALGWNTFNGDHMSMYQINASIPKTMVLAALKGLAQTSEGRLAALLDEIAEAPITPELVPNAADNDSENRLGPYELHDFFLYHFLADGMSREKLLQLARIAFKGHYGDATISGTLDKFWKRFLAAQYKRNCVPDGPKITLSLSPRADWRMPSDADMG